MSDQNATKLHGLAFTAYAEGVRRETPGAQLTVLELQNQIANTAERFIVAARWLADKLTRAADEVANETDFARVGHDAAECRGTSLLMDVPAIAAELYLLQNVLQVARSNARDVAQP